MEENSAKIHEELQKKQAALDEAKKIIDRNCQEMERLVNLKNDFLSAVSHELRTPLTSIKESIALIEDGSAGPLSENQKKFLNIARNNIDRLSRLINNMLDFSKIEEGKLKLVKKVSKFDQMISEVAKTLALGLGKKNIDFQVVLEDHLPEVFLDPDRIIQVILNLVSNALKFTPVGGRITVTAKQVTDFPGLSEIKDSYPAGQKFIHLTVADTGPGIKEEDLAKLFQKFQQLEGGLGRHFDGVGLGLVITKQFIESHQGRIWVTSKYKEGANFQFVIPVVTPPVILVVDDEKNIVETIEFLLETKHYRVLKAYDGAEALAVVKNNLPDLIILDIRMPKVDGYEVVKELKRNEATGKIPILILSGYIVDTGLLKCNGLGLVHSVAKPFNPEELMNEINALLRGE